MLIKADLNNNPYLGVFCRANDSMMLVPMNAADGAVSRISEALGVECCRFSVGGASLLGSLVCMNNKGAVLSNVASRQDLEQMREKMPAITLGERLNAVGNNILCNDSGALVNPDYSRRAIEQIGKALGVKVAKGTVGGQKIVGAAGLATNRGVLCHPHTTEKEMAAISETLEVPAHIGTVNYGIPLVGACMLANTKGAAVGLPTTTVEIGRVEEAFMLY